VRIAFWLSAAFVVYVYLGYPVVLMAWVRLRGLRQRSARLSAERPQELPGVSIVIAARNEARHLTARIENLLALDYPADRRQIIVVSDGSTDATVEVLARFGDAVETVALPHGGKAVALNAGVARARHEVIVFADARQTFAPDALRALVAPLADPGVGGVTGELLLDCEAGGERRRKDRRKVAGAAYSSRDRRTKERRTLQSTIRDGVSIYWRYEKLLRRLESAIGSTVGATGAIYALRRSLWQPLPPEALLDDVLAPMRAVLARRRMVFEERAKAFDGTTTGSAAEMRRKIRTLAGNVQLLWLEPRLVLPLVNPVWLQFCSHKLARLLVPYALLALLAANMALAAEHLFYAVTLAGQCAFYMLGGYGAWLEWQGVAPVSALEPQESRT